MSGTVHYERATNLATGAACDVTGPYDLTEDMSECTCIACVVAARDVAVGVLDCCDVRLDELDPCGDLRDREQVEP